MHAPSYRSASHPRGREWACALAGEAMATILLVDDDPLQALLRKSALERRFRDVERVHDAAEALCLVEQAHFPRDLGLVIVGHHAAGFGGLEFVAELHVRMPELKVLVIGGHGESPSDYAETRVYFLPRQASVDELIELAQFLLEHRLRNAA
jgi:DNA-binding NtrC family response regulator